MTTFNENSFAPWRKLNPLRERHQRMGKILLGGLALLFIDVVVLLYRTRGILFDLEVALSTIDLVLMVSFIVGFFLLAGVFFILDARTDKAQASAVRKWVAKTQPDPLFLARMSVSEEIEMAERGAAVSILDESNRHWRVKVIQDPAANGPTLPVDIEVPSFPATPKKEARIDIALGFVLAVFALVGAGLFLTENFLLAGLSLIPVISLIMILHVLTERPFEQRRKAWEQDLLQKFSPEELVVFESYNSETTEGRYIKKFLFNSHPGWTLTPVRPLWKVVCDC